VRIAPVVWHVLRYACALDDKPERLPSQIEDEDELDDGDRVAGCIPLCSWCLLVDSACDAPVKTNEVDRLLSRDPDAS
jgi:hypothetical protein